MDIQKRLDEIEKRTSSQILNALETHIAQLTKDSLSKFSLALKAIVYNHGQAYRRASLEYLAEKVNCNDKKCTIAISFNGGKVDSIQDLVDKMES